MRGGNKNKILAGIISNSQDHWQQMDYPKMTDGLFRSIEQCCFLLLRVLDEIAALTQASSNRITVHTFQELSSDAMWMCKDTITTVHLNL